MTNQTKNGQSKHATANAFMYNILVPDLALFVIGISLGFGGLLTLFS